MCLTAFSFQHHPDYALVLAANRDEFFARPAAPADFWTDHPSILAGRDLQAGGTWLGVTRDKRWALLTNFRDPKLHRNSALSRGSLAPDFLAGTESPESYLTRVADQSTRYNPFNILVGNEREAAYFSPVQGRVQMLSPGTYAMSNHLLETPWPKVRKARDVMTEALRMSEREALKNALFEMLRDPSLAPDESLPDTGVGLDRERALSAIFITMPGYGTRCSTVLLIDREGRVDFTETSFSEDRSQAPVSRHFRF